MTEQQPVVPVNAGDWVSAWSTTLRSPGAGIVTGKVIKGPHKISYIGWGGLVTTMCIEIVNALGRFTVPVEAVIEKIDPVLTWQRLRPGEPTPKWLSEQLNTKEGDDE